MHAILGQKQALEAERISGLLQLVEVFMVCIRNSFVNEFCMVKAVTGHENNQ